MIISQSIRFSSVNSRSMTPGFTPWSQSRTANHRLMSVTNIVLHKKDLRYSQSKTTTIEVWFGAFFQYCGIEFRWHVFFYLVITCARQLVTNYRSTLYKGFVSIFHFEKKENLLHTNVCICNKFFFVKLLTLIFLSSIFPWNKYAEDLPFWIQIIKHIFLWDKYRHVKID